MTKKLDIGVDGLEPRAKKTAQQTLKIPRKSLLAAFENSRATHHVTNYLQGYGLKPLRHNELKSIFALFAWVANEQKAAEETVQLITETHFNVKDVTKLQQKDYDEVIQFLVDLRIDELRN